MFLKDRENNLPKQIVGYSTQAIQFGGGVKGAGKSSYGDYSVPENLSSHAKLNFLIATYFQPSFIKAENNVFLPL